MGVDGGGRGVRGKEFEVDGVGIVCLFPKSVPFIPYPSSIPISISPNNPRTKKKPNHFEEIRSRRGEGKEKERKNSPIGIIHSQ